MSDMDDDMYDDDDYDLVSQCFVCFKASHIAK